MDRARVSEREPDSILSQRRLLPLSLSRFKKMTSLGQNGYGLRLVVLQEAFYSLNCMHSLNEELHKSVLT